MRLHITPLVPGEARYRATSPWNFCHVQFRLSSDGTRLFAHGCTWAAPYSVRIYDATPWTCGTTPGSDFPLPILFEQSEGEILQCGDVDPLEPLSDGRVLCVTSVRLAEVPARGSEDDVDWREHAAEDDLALANELQAAAATHSFAIVLRRVETSDGRVVDRRVVPYSSSHEGQVLIDGDRVIVVGSERAFRLDMVRDLHVDLGPVPPLSAHSRVTASMCGGRLVYLVHGA